MVTRDVQVPPTELLGVLDLISKVKQEQISELVAAPRLMQCRRDVYHKKPAHQMASCPRHTHLLSFGTPTEVIVI
jgi:hypothetical protein